MSRKSGGEHAGWLTEDLRDEVREVFNKRYNRELSNNEIEEIAMNLTMTTEALLKFGIKLNIEGTC